jgi:hypothetical protein
MGTLAAGFYTTSSVIDLGPSIPLDVTFEVEFTPNGAPTSSKQLLLFAKLSLDNVNFGTGGTDSNDESQLHFIGAVPAYGTSILHRKFLRLNQLEIPITRYIKLVVKNDMGVALASGEVYKADIAGASV